VASLTYQRPMCQLTAWAVIDLDLRCLALSHIDTAAATDMQNNTFQLHIHKQVPYEEICKALKHLIRI